MEKIIVNNDITILYITAKSYPDGIMDAHKKLHSIIPFSKDRHYFAVSRPENGSIVYRAGAEEINTGEASTLKCDTLVIKKGNYVSLIINDYMKNLQSISNAFAELLSHPDIDPQGYCVEWYLSEKDVRCMVRLKE